MAELRRKCVVDLINSYPSSSEVADIEGCLYINYDGDFIVRKFDYEYYALDKQGNEIEKYLTLEEAKESPYYDGYVKMDEAMKKGLYPSLERMGYPVDLYE